MNIQDLILEAFNYDDDDEEVLVNEDVMPITPFLAYASFKRKTFGKLKDKMFDIKTKLGDWSTSSKAERLIAKEKSAARSGNISGDGDNATVYRLTQEQKRVMVDIYENYGKTIISDIMEFRKNVLAPYSLIKRKVKEASRVTNTDKFGMTKAEYKVYYESGKRKIENRGDKFLEASENLRDRVGRINSQIDLLDQAKDKMRENDFPVSILSRLYKEYSVYDSDLLGYSPSELRGAYNKTQEDIDEILRKLERIQTQGYSEEDIDDVIIRASQRPMVKKDDKEKSDEKEKAKGDFNIALGRYMFRREILDKLKEEDINIYKKSYLKIIDEMIKHLIEIKQSTITKLASLNRSMDLNDKEKMIWKKRSGASKYSDNINDFYLAIEEKDFLNAPIYLERTPELKEAEQKIENEIKRFERSLEKKISKEDFAKLKKYRLINNLITIRDLKSPQDLFKDTEELKKTMNVTDKDVKDSENYIGIDDFKRRLWQINNTPFNNMSQLSDARKEVKDLVDRMKQQGNENVVNSMKDVIKNIEIRGIKPLGSDNNNNGYIDIDDIKAKAIEIANDNYETEQEKKREEQRLQKMVDGFSSNDPSSKQELNNIYNLLSKTNIKVNY